MGKTFEVRPEELCHRCDPGHFPFETTAELGDSTEIIGQSRAIEAVQFGLGIHQEGYNLFALGPSGLGRHFVVSHLLEQEAASRPVPSDWCYINNFQDPQNPRALELPPGEGARLRADMEDLVEELRSAIPVAFESQDYRARKQVIEGEVKERQERALEEVRSQAQAKGIAVMRTPTGLVLAPVRNDQVLSPEEFGRLPDEERQQIEADIGELHKLLQEAVRDAPAWEREGRAKTRELNREVTRFAVGHLIDEVRKKYQSFPEVASYLDSVQQDAIENADEFLSPPESPLPALLEMLQPGAPKSSPFFRRYQVNLMVDRGGQKGAPVVYEDNPTYQNLLGQAEYVGHMGTLVTDFSLIRAGALHRANGGFLIVDVQRVLQQPYAWEGLKRALRSSEIRIESLGQALGLISTVSLEPEPIPLTTKVVLVGERWLYYSLSSVDPEFRGLFKVAADFEEDTKRNPESELLHAQFVAGLARREKLLPFHRSAVARVIEHSARLAGDAEKLSTHRHALADLLRESDHCAHQAGHATVNEDDVRRAVEARIRRADRVRERLQDEIQRGTILIDTEGEKVGQVNGLSVIQLGEIPFGHPSRITARIRLGKGEVVDIEREVELSGPIHSKGVLILSAFLGARYAADRPLSLSASLVFEQSYGGVEGDSASCAELYALLSALADAPIKQSLAVTGSVNQHGQVQAIGGVNEKIEGFFDICKKRNLTGSQGTLIPASNAKHLMLREDVVEAAAAGMFHVYAIETIDQGIEILTGIPAGERDSSGKFPEGSINQRVEARLMELAERRMTFAREAEPEARK